MMPFPSETMKAAPEPAIDGSPCGILAVQFLARHEMTLEPELLKLASAVSWRLRQLGGRQLGGQYVSWDATAGAAGPLLHKLVRLVRLRHPK